MLKRFKLFENQYSGVGWQNVSKDYKLSDDLYDDELGVYNVGIGDRIYHINSGPGTIISRNGKIVNIQFDGDSGRNKITFLLSTLVDNNLIKMIDEEPEEGSISPDLNFVNDPTVSQPKEIVAKPMVEEEEEEEEEEEDDYDDGDDGDDGLIDVTVEELMTIDIEEFFNEGEMTLLVSIEDILKYREKIKQITKYEDNPFKNKLNEKRLKDTYIIEKYYKYLSNRIGRDVYRFNGQIPYGELWDIRQKDKIEITDDMYDSHIFNSGVVFFWVFKNAVVFKTV